MTIEVLICTYGNGITRAADVVLPPACDIHWLVSWQSDDACPTPPPSLQRADVRVVTMPDRGLSRNRNNALRHAQGDVLVLADDDNRYTEQELRDVTRLFEENPRLDIALLRSMTHEGGWMKEYPARTFDYSHRPYGYYVQSSDIAMRRSAVQGLRFDERFGIGAPLPGGEEELFVHQAWKKGLCVAYHPFTLCRTAPVTTGSRMDSDPSLLKAKGALLAIFHGRLGATLRVIKYSLTRHVTLAPMIKGVWMHL